MKLYPPLKLGQFLPGKTTDLVIIFLFFKNQSNYYYFKLIHLDIPYNVDLYSPTGVKLGNLNFISKKK